MTSQIQPHRYFGNSDASVRQNFGSKKPHQAARLYGSLLDPIEWIVLVYTLQCNNLSTIPEVQKRVVDMGEFQL